MTSNLPKISSVQLATLRAIRDGEKPSLANENERHQLLYAGWITYTDYMWRLTEAATRMLDNGYFVEVNTPAVYREANAIYEKTYAKDGKMGTNLLHDQVTITVFGGSIGSGVTFAANDPQIEYVERVLVKAFQRGELAAKASIRSALGL